MSKVSWNRTDVNDLEGVVGVMLCRENPRAQRVRPAQGDGGIDIYVPDDKGTWTVYQVKSFTGPLKPSHKAQITKSWKTFQAFAEKELLKVKAWYLVRPEDPTLLDIAWLEALTNGAPFPCEWLGLSFCDRLAADHQSVIDYYLNNGKERLQTAVSDLLAVIGSNAAAMTQPGETRQQLQAIHHAINSLDPHFRYDFRVETFPVDENGVAIMPAIDTYPDNVLAATIHAGPGGQAITYLIYARYQEAIVERPVPGKVTLTAEPRTAEAAALQDFYEYGLPLRHAAVTDVDLDLPGGLGIMAGRDGYVQIGPSRVTTAKPVRLELVVIEELTDNVVASVDLDMEPATKGLVGDKFALRGEESAGVFGVVFRYDPSANRVLTSFSTRPLAGLDPTDVLPGLSLLTVLAPPYRMQLRFRNGPPLDKAHAIPEAFLREPDQVLELVEALATIQAHSFVPIVVPDLSTTTMDEVNNWIHTARLLRGGAIATNWEHVDVLPYEGVSLGDDAFTVATQEVLAVVINGVMINLGYKLLHLEAAKLGSDQSGTQPGFLRLTPAASERAWIRWQPSPFFPEVAGINTFTQPIEPGTSPG